MVTKIALLGAIVLASFAFATKGSSGATRAPSMLESVSSLLHEESRLLP